MNPNARFIIEDKKVILLSPKNLVAVKAKIAFKNLSDPDYIFEKEFSGLEEANMIDEEFKSYNFMIDIKHNKLVFMDYKL